MKIDELIDLAGNFHKTAGIFEGPPEMVKTISAWALGIFAAQVWLICKNRIASAANKERDEYVKLMIVESTLIIQECKKYAKKPATRLARTGSINFPIDYIFNWKYLTPLQQKHGAKFLMEKMDWPPSIKVSFVFNLTSKPKDLTEDDWDALWLPESKEIYLFASPNITNTNKFHWAVRKILDEVRHEVQHMGQWALKDIKALNVYPGLPSKEMRSTLVDAHGTPIYPSEKDKDERIEHAHRDIEFYTNLQDSINNFKNLAKGEKDAGSFAKFWVGLDPTFKSQTKSQPDYFFVSLKNNNPAKWRKAVTELYKTI